MLTRNYSWLSEQIFSVPPKPGFRLIALDGPAGSGKTSLARRLAGTLPGAVVVPVDDFLAWDDLTDFWPRLEEQLLRPLGEARTARYQVRDWAGDRLGRGLKDWKELPCPEILILEGVGSSRLQIMDRLTCSIWMETPAEVRLARGIERDGEKMRGLWLNWQKLEDDFFQADRTRDRAHFIIDGTYRDTANSEAIKIIGGNLLKTPLFNADN